MKTLQEQIITKQDEYIAYLKNQCRLTSLSVERYESELSALKAQAEQVKATNRELFEKVYIRSESDLPKEDDAYFVQYKDHQIGAELFSVSGHQKGIQFDWIGLIDWYLRPVEAEQPPNNRLQSENSADNLKTAEEILKNVLNDVYTKAGVPSGSHTVTKEDALNAMEEYAAQFKAEQEKVTNEDIKKWADEVQPERGGYVSDYIFAAKAMRDGLITHTK